MSIMDTSKQAYLDEAREMLSELEEGLLEIEENPDNKECLARVFRAMHTIKGSGSMFGFEEIARFTHDVETVLDRVRNGEVSFTKELLTLTLQAKDHVHALLQEPPEGTPESRARSDTLLASFRNYLPGAGGDAKPESTAEATPAAGADEPVRTFWIRYRPAPDTFFSGTRPLALVEELLGLGTGIEIFHPEDIPDLENYETSKAYGWWDILLTTTLGENAIQDVFIFVEDEGGVGVRELGQQGVRCSDLKSMAQIIRDNLSEAEEVLHEALRQAFNVCLQQRELAKPKESKAPQRPAAEPQAASIRVDAKRLDSLVNMVGEMVILQARLSIASKALRNTTISQIAEDMERLTVQMRENALGMRMLPIGTVFGSMRRMVRDVTNSLGKEVDFQTEGGDTELDKTVIEKLKDPLMHILRNALDHGLESPDFREEAGKPREGTLLLRAKHSRGDVLLEITDDGKGIDVEVLKQKAIEKGLITPDATLDKKEALNILFIPGFSTAKEVTGLSGRGVGMDVVKRSLDSIRGSVDIESEPGKGTTISIRLPLTLAIIDGLNVLVAEESYILPLVNIESCQERFVEKDPPFVDTMEYMENMIPCVSLRKLLRTPGEQPDYERIIVVNVDDALVGLAVDSVIGRQQAVIKSLSELYDDVDFISGTTVNGHGSVSLILDVPQVVRRAMRKSEQ